VCLVQDTRAYQSTGSQLDLILFLKRINVVTKTYGTWHSTLSFIFGINVVTKTSICYMAYHSSLSRIKVVCLKFETESKKIAEFKN